MLLLISFLLTIIGCINWLLIGLLQYDFVAGIFGYQGSVFSRLIYIVIGAGAVFFLFKVLINKGEVEIFNFKKRDKKKENSRVFNVESSLENNFNEDNKHFGERYSNPRQTYHSSRFDDYSENTIDDINQHKHIHDGLLDEHFDDED